MSNTIIEYKQPKNALQVAGLFVCTRLMDVGATLLTLNKYGFSYETEINPYLRYLFARGIADFIFWQLAMTGLGLLLVRIRLGRLALLIFSFISGLAALFNLAIYFIF